MGTVKRVAIDKLIYYRLVALWVLCEAMLGGIIHGFKIPVSGLIVGSCAVVCISLIAYYVPAKGSILKATVTVAVFKMMLSPQAPPPAYIAVFFQGLMGELLFWKKNLYRLSCFLLAILALLESGFQRILVLTIVYGNDFWKAIDNFLNNLTKQKTATHYSFIIGGSYVLLHLITGLLVGWWASVLPDRINKWSKEENKIIITNNNSPIAVNSSNRGKQVKTGLFIVWIVFIILYMQSYFKIGVPILPSQVSLKILLRSIIIVLGWYFIFRPLLKQLLHHWLQRKRTKTQEDIRQILQLLPGTQQLISQSWKLTADKKRWKRLFAFSKLVLINALNDPVDKSVFIVTGQIQAGKTTSLVEWSCGKKDVHGILSPVINGKRVFMDAYTREQFPMEADENETEVLLIGQFVFDKKAFDKAKQIILDAMNKEGWLVIDEIGPLELKGEGFCDVLTEILKRSNKELKVLLIVREGLVNKVKDFFGLQNATVITGLRNIGHSLTTVPVM